MICAPDVAESFAEPVGTFRLKGCAAREPESCFGHEYEPIADLPRELQVRSGC
jgi:hypothetical protein